MRMARVAVPVADQINEMSNPLKGSNGGMEEILWKVFNEIMAMVCPWVPALSSAQTSAALVALLGGEKEQQPAASAGKDRPCTTLPRIQLMLPAGSVLPTLEQGRG